ncbi:hypothetical protein [Corynebacterium sp.]|jgi:amino acid permease|uniref:hypothetical protein n=1 Tax=Corynebacterium sp. TaxID=1720 RepID=UPI0025C3FD66|nr:hypothetical protein [Corynebacterium sp.]
MGDVMNVVIIAALLSAGNSGLFSCTRMLHSMAGEGQAPKAFMRTTKRGIPMLAQCVDGRWCGLTAVERDRAGLHYKAPASRVLASISIVALVAFRRG